MVSKGLHILGNIIKIKIRYAIFVLFGKNNSKNTERKNVQRAKAQG